MTQKFLNEALSSVVGKQGEELLEMLDDKKYVNEFLIAKKLNITINQARNILYRLSDKGLVSSIRKKDKRKGWYTYFWKIELLKSLFFLREMLSEKISQIEHQIKSRETKRFYFCDRCHVEYNEENSLFHDFICDECGNVLVFKDNEKLLKDLKKELQKFDNQRKEIDVEISKEKEKLEKKKRKNERKEEKEKKMKKEAKKLKNREEKAKLKGKNKVQNKSSSKTKKTKKSEDKKTKKTKSKVKTSKIKTKKRK